VEFTRKVPHEAWNGVSSSIVQKIFDVMGGQMSEGLPHHQHISEISTQKHSQAFVGSARDVYFAASRSSQGTVLYTGGTLS
jgi:hypothetical protein